MALNVWIQPSGYSFGVINEGLRVNVKLPVLTTPGVTYKVISGKLPPGVRIEGEYIVGSIFEVSRTTKFTFCIRAQLNNDIADRTFSVVVEGADNPTFVTPAGDLTIGEHQQYFVLDNTYVNYQIEAYDADIAAGQQLSFFIADNDGELPPGLVLTNDGRIVGFVQPVLSIKPEDGDGSYDNSYFDAVAYDFGSRPSNGFDSFIYDTAYYDYSLPSKAPVKLNRYYEFIISVTDGDTITKRKFRIFVVGDDYFRADNTRWLDGTGLFTADVTYLRAPIWLTSSNLGTYRANNYVTLILDTYDTSGVFYELSIVNSDISATTKRIQNSDNTVGGYSITTILTSNTPETGQFITFNGLFNGATSTTYRITAVENLSSDSYRLTIGTPLEVSIPDETRFLIGSLSSLPPGLAFDIKTAELRGIVPYQPAITKEYNFTVTAYRISDKLEYARSSRKFTVSIIGEVDSTIVWNSDSNLGSINANFISMLNVSATSTIPNSTVIYTLTGGALPPGLTISPSGEIIGKVNQYGDQSTGLAGLLTFNVNQQLHPTVSELPTTFDNNSTTFDRKYTFTIRARDQYGYSASTKTFYITVETPNAITFSNIRVQPFLKTTVDTWELSVNAGAKSQRMRFKDFINDPTIFTPSSIYRPNDKNFGVQKDLSMLIYAGIETREAAVYVSAIGLNHKKKRFHFGEIKKAVAIKPGTTEQIYEVVYVEMIDPLEINGKYLPSRLSNLGKQQSKISTDLSISLWAPGFSPKTDAAKRAALQVPAPVAVRPEPILTTDSTGYFPSSPNSNNYYPSSTRIWRDRIKNWRSDSNDASTGLEHERNYLPLWMRSIQPNTRTELDFVLAVPLCYCKIGTASDIILNIKYSNFDFKLLDYTADRYIIDSTEGLTQDKYLVFKNDRITV